MLDLVNRIFVLNFRFIVPVFIFWSSARSAVRDDRQRIDGRIVSAAKAIVIFKHSFGKMLVCISLHLDMKDDKLGIAVFPVNFDQFIHEPGFGIRIFFRKYYPLFFIQKFNMIQVKMPCELGFEKPKEIFEHFLQKASKSLRGLVKYATSSSPTMLIPKSGCNPTSAVIQYIIVYFLCVQITNNIGFVKRKMKV